jgi:hypothetical protein
MSRPFLGGDYDIFRAANLGQDHGLGEVPARRIELDGTEEGFPIARGERVAYLRRLEALRPGHP